ncbi:uncharacterized protein ASCRUDRAFT_127304 [Ascoidea rubescens DSM 1968]|uniref:Uncharacterized protein n=1 Tax=Ascoidea rubescens DSM 1968 TaxID=1344418 RepID=A0A1D2VNF4_9ASCO|nr:hypothetical protein ASCRUDRAFT_127304 [Ascoidea rubescens DSM 1968]ODV63126.1 hypothetical protein ASCRUDRAFT_127304 [Ascoidea rubescens DSM 1968]
MSLSKYLTANNKLNISKVIVNGDKQHQRYYVVCLLNRSYIGDKLGLIYEKENAADMVNAEGQRDKAIEQERKEQIDIENKGWEQLKRFGGNCREINEDENN